jgi:hypothetical protein
MKRLLAIVALAGLSACTVYPDGTLTVHSPPPSYHYVAPVYRAPVYVAPRYYAPRYHAPRYYGRPVYRRHW